MRQGVAEWVQDGRLYVWRYAQPNRSWRGWHFTADPSGCRSIANLLDRMHGGDACHRTLRLDEVTDAILAGPNYGHSIAGRFTKLRIEYRPEAENLDLQAEADVLTMIVAPARLRKVVTAFRHVEIGTGDFGIETSSSRKADHWMFWWMPWSLGFYRQAKQ